MKLRFLITIVILFFTKVIFAQSNFNDVAYGSDAKQKLDIYLPKPAKAKSKAIILIHGGSWIGGDKTNMNHWLVQLENNLPDYTIFNLNYRLASRQNMANAWPAQISDVDKAIDFIKSKSKEYHIDVHQMVILGESAGAQLALVEAYRDPENVKFKTVVDLFGPADMANLYSAHHELGLLMDGTPETKPQVYNDASAVDLVDKATPPTIIFHGTADHLVPIIESDSLNAALKEAKVDVKFIKYEGKGHGWRGPELQDTYQKTIDFIKRHN